MKRHLVKHPVLANTSSSVVKFEVGQTYTSSGLYGGGDITYRVVSRTANTVTLAESHVSEDDWSQVDDGQKEYNIVIQDRYDSDYKNVIGKQESVVIWEYSGHEGYLFADSDEIEEDIDDVEDIEDEYDEDDYLSSSAYGDYSPSNPWDAPGMSMRDFL